MKKTIQFAICGLILAAAPCVMAIAYGGVEFPQGASSFADQVIFYDVVGGGVAAPYNDPSTALGIPDYPSDNSGSVSLGASPGGSLVLKFTDNSLTTSGTSAKDLWIFEIGGAVEPTHVFIGKNGYDWIDLGLIEGSTRGVDIDAFINAGVELGAQYSYVKLVEVDYDGAPDSYYPFAGADIDAVGAISSAPPVHTPDTGCSLVMVLGGLASLAAYRRKL